MLNLDLKGTVKPALKKLKGEYSEKFFKAQEDRLREEEKVKHCEELLIEKSNLIAQLDAQLKRLEGQIKMEKRFVGRVFKTKRR